MRSKHLPQVLQGLRMPVIAAPMFTVSYPELVKAQCRAGIVGSFPALNARPAELLDEWLTQIQEELQAYQAKYPERKVGPIAVNQIVHVSNTRLERDMQICVKHRIPIYITSLRAPIKEMIDAVHSYGGIVLHDVISLRHAEKALEAGVDGLILVAAGAGGHAGGLSPFALVGEVRKIFSGPIVLSGSISNGSAVLAANAMGADFAYMGTRFIASQEAHATEAYKRAIVEANASDIVYTDYFTGILGNYIKKSIENAGLDPNHLPAGDPGAFAKLSQENKDGGASKAWKDIWGAGQGVGLIDNVPTVAQIVDTLEQEYRDAKKSLLS
ncbi:nitronate monooxygenase family protein [Polynucleobacter sp.]|uniref:NAD(P)H-dependent flavin oxidoreductase n=1 Tax=Polynucleobacter sp. TaxID=2029855 RepID=UPI00261D390D|nr:nitronate monooxygenase family protein [Polynucleobacter sp.]MCW1964852.1 nitronate monooxygenase family protein [Polynucleobacter sp.]